MADEDNKDKPKEDEDYNVYHGLDNKLRWSKNDKIVTPADIAIFGGKMKLIAFAPRITLHRVPLHCNHIHLEGLK